jgi:hypothetical protein
MFIWRVVAILGKLNLALPNQYVSTAFYSAVMCSDGHMDF